MSERGVFTMRAARRTIRALEEEARRYRLAPRTLAEQILEEGIRMRRHPGIVYVDGTVGRDAVLAARPGLTIWEIVMLSRGMSRSSAARSLSIDVGSLERALAFYRDYPEEIDAAIRENEEAFERAKRLYPPALTTPPKLRRRRAAAAR